MPASRYTAVMTWMDDPVSARGPGGAVSVSLRMLLLVRWVAVVGQAVSLLVVHFGLGFAMPIVPAMAVVAASALLNVIGMVARGTSARLGEIEAASYLAYDIVQLGVLLFLTGGLENPFAILAIAPVTVAATVLSRPSIIGLSALTVTVISLLAVLHLPLPWRGVPPAFSPLFVLGVWIALIFAALFIAGYTWTVAEEARRMRDAFAATQLALAREQRVSAVGALAAAAAHELGSPLATIAVVAKELARDLPPGNPHAEDAALLLSQSERCRMILADLAQQRVSESGSPYARLPISALVEAAGEPYRTEHVRVLYATGAGGAGPSGEEPQVQRSPEIMHGLGNLIQNAVTFARREVIVTTDWGEREITVEVVDDGPGFSANVLARIGEPYISGRGGEAQHMGLGIFIAQSLLERTGARLGFGNLAEGGAQVMVEWPRAALEVQQRAPSREEAGS
ncbi:MAG TPA: ActS/PrrB/RegB family redox-sensitive histidine kinase [Stellaceae bacterium]|nr:ActS/PrrB/RegB family redox-sensitive histidine kinase [Stellaceae bacterium]